MKNKNFQSRVCVCTASTNLLCTIKPCRNGEKNAGSENDIIGSIYYNLYSAAETYWGKNKGRSMEGTLVKVTKYLAVGFIILAVILNLNVF